MGVNRLSERSQKLALDVRFGSTTACRQRQQSAALYRSCLLSVLVKSDAIGGLIECKRLVNCNANEWSSGVQLPTSPAEPIDAPYDIAGTKFMTGQFMLKPRPYAERISV